MIVHFWENSPKKMIHILKRELVGKLVGFDGIFESTQIWRTEGHLKNTWLIDSSESPHLWQDMSPCIPRAFRFFLTTMHPETIRHKKCFIFGGHRTFQQNSFSISTFGPKNFSGFPYSGRPFLIGIRLDRVFPIISEMSSIPVHQLSPTQWYASDNVHVLGIHQSPNCLWVPCPRG